MSESIHVTIPDWMKKEILGEPDNKSQRVQELLHKGHLYEKLQRMAQQDNIKAYAGKPEDEEHKKGSGPTGHCIYAVGSPLRFSSDFERLNPRTSVSTTSAKITE